MLGVAFHPHSLCLDQRGSPAATRTFGGLASGAVDLEHVITFHNFTCNTISLGPISDITDGHLLLHRRRVGPAVVFCDYHQRQLQHGSKVQALVKRSGAGGAIAHESAIGLGVDELHLNRQSAVVRRHAAGDDRFDPHLGSGVLDLAVR